MNTGPCWNRERFCVTFTLLLMHFKGAPAGDRPVGRSGERSCSFRLSECFGSAVHEDADASEQNLQTHGLVTLQVPAWPPEEQKRFLPWEQYGTFHLHYRSNSMAYLDLKNQVMEIYSIPWLPQLSTHITNPIILSISVHDFLTKTPHSCIF